MNIVIANNYYYLRGGSEKVFFDELNLLKEKGHKVAPFSVNDRNSISAFGNCPEFPDDIRHIERILSYFWNREASNKLELLLSKNRYEIFHGHNIHSRLTHATTLKARERGLKVVITLHDMKYVCPHYTMLSHGTICEDCNGGRYFKAILNKCHKDSYLASLIVASELYFFNVLHLQEKVDSFIAPSNFLKNKYLEMGFKGRIDYLPNFININVSHKIKNFNNQNSHYLYVGRLSYEKGIMTLLEAFKISNRLLKIAGDGPLKTHIEEFIKINNLEQRIFLLGYLNSDRVYEELVSSKALIVPSEWYENAPLSILEAMALGVIVIGSNIGGIPEMIHDFKNGILFKPGDYNDINNALDKFESFSERELSEMRNYSNMLINTTFSKEEHYKKLINIYEKVLNI